MTSRAIIAMGEGFGGGVLYFAGADITFMVGESVTDLSDLGLDNAPRGLSVWEGRYVARDYPNGDDSEPVGAFRPLTDAEWEAVRRGENPWPDDVVCPGCYAAKGAPHSVTCAATGEPQG